MATIKCINCKGKYHDNNAKYDVISYILNSDKMPHGYFGMVHVNPANPDLSMWDVAMMFDKEKGVRLRHYIVSFYKTEVQNPALANIIANELMCAIGSKYQCIYGVHENTDELHFHIVFNTVSFVDGDRFYGTKAEHYALMDTIKAICRKYGLIIYYVKNTTVHDEN